MITSATATSTNHSAQLSTAPLLRTHSDTQTIGSRRGRKKNTAAHAHTPAEHDGRNPTPRATLVKLVPPLAASTTQSQREKRLFPRACREHCLVFELVA